MALIRRAFLASALSFGAAACGTTQSLRPQETNPQGFAAWTDSPPLYRLGAGDRVKVDFLMTPEVGEEVIVGPDGYIGLKVAGRLPAQNLTLDQLQAEIGKAAAYNLKNPIVTATVVEAKSSRVIVGGQVAAPGVYPLPARASTLEAVILAGGFLPESRMDEVVLIRYRPDNTPMLRTVDLRRQIATGAPEQRVPLAPEDIVFVPRSRVAEVNLWVEENINRTLPFTRSVNYTSDGTVIR